MNDGPRRSGDWSRRIVHSPGVLLLRAARSYSLCADDAQDAVQRALEIYMRRVESLDPATELAWLKVVVIRTFSACDLDNFAKPVLDTLFTSQNVSRLNGVLLPGVNDTWVFRLVLEKVGVRSPQEQGADITVTWHPSGTPDLGTS